MPARLTTEEFIEKATQVHNGRFDYTESVYINWKTKIKVKCPEHGVFCPQAGVHLLGFNCPECTIITGRPKQSEAERFWKRVNKDGPTMSHMTTPCWEWSGSTSNGYGRFNRYSRLRNAHIYAHKFSYEIHCGQIPDGLYVLHRCDNPPCVNPDHLFLGTYADNHKDMISKGRNPVGEKNGSKKYPERLKRGDDSPVAKLNTQAVIEIRATWQDSRNRTGLIAKFARRFDVHPQTIKSVIKNETWKHIKVP